MKKLTLILIALLGIMAITSAQNRALDFNGVSPYENVDCGIFNLSGDSFTYECWFKVDAFGGLSNLIGFEAGSTNTALIRINDSKLEFLWAEQGYSYYVVTGSTTLETNEWYHVAGVFDDNGTGAATAYLFLNGEQDGYATGMGATVSANSTFYIGGSGGRYLNGQMDEVRVWKGVARTQTQVIDNMYTELAGTETGLFAYYKLNETTGTTAYDSQTSGTYDGTLANCTFNTNSVAAGWVPIYVDASATGGTYNGTSWATAYKTLQEALDAAAVTGNSIWVAGGTYYPSKDPDGNDNGIYNTFQMIDGVEIYGGFAVNETSPFQRTDYGIGGANETILSGDIGTVDIDTDNCYHVFYHPDYTDLDNTAILDGFTITKGNANASSGVNRWGGGILNEESSPKITNCIFTDNYAGYGGGGIANNESSSPEIFNCVFINNESNSQGGAMFNRNASSPTVVNCTFTNNTSATGGAISNYVANSANPECTPILKNTILWDNSATSDAQISNTNSTPTVSYCDIEGSFPSGSWDGSLGTNVIGNIDSNPLFADAGNDDYRITSLSPCADEGSDAANSETTDIRGSGFGRKLSKDNYLNTGTIDMGAYEFNSNTDPAFSTLIWTGSTSNDFTVAGNWDGGVPTSSYNIRIPNVANDPVIAYNKTADCNNLTVESGATLTLESTSAGTGSLIVAGTATGDVTVERYLTLGSWHYISEPVNDIRVFNVFLGLIPETGTDIDQFYWWDENGMYDGNTGIWFDILNNPTEISYTANSFIPSQGYAINYSGTGETKINFVGEPYTINKTIEITKTEASTNAGGNLIGNPFSSTIALNTGADATNNFLADNGALLDGTYGALYLWNEQANYEGDRNDYYPVNLATGTEFAAPGQGFMIVKADIGSSTVNFNAATRKHGSATFYKNSNDDATPRFKLFVKDAENRANTTTIAFLPNMTLGLDHLYDAGKLKGNPNIALYTRLVEDTGVDFAIQALPDYDIESIIIPVGIDIIESIICEFSIKPEVMEGYQVYLQDTQENTVTNLKENSYSTLVSESGTGRFFLHFKEVLGVDEPTTATQLIQLWAANSTINIFNKHNLNGVVKVLNTFGQVVVATKLTGDANQQITVNSQSGIYIVNITTNKGMVNKKVYLR